MRADKDAAANLAVKDLKAAPTAAAARPCSSTSRSTPATNEATAVTWTRKGEVHAADGMKAARFNDPDGNIFSIVSS